MIFQWSYLSLDYQDIALYLSILLDTVKEKSLMYYISLLKIKFGNLKTSVQLVAKLSC